MAPVTKVPTTTSDYTILPLRITPSPSYVVSAQHYLYIRAHDPKIPDERSPRSLFIVNVPVDATELHFRSLFADQLGGSRVEHVEFETTRPAKSVSAKQAPSQNSKKRKRAAQEDLVVELPQTWDRDLQRSGSAAIVVFVDRASMDVAFKNVKKAAKARTEVVWGKGVEDRLPKLGSQRYRTHHDMRFPSKADLQASVDAYMAGFAAAEVQKSRLTARQRAVPDEDGFITVTRGGRAGPARNEEAQEKLEELTKKETDKRAGMGDFYRFQLREKNKQRAGELVKRFQQDRKRVDEMRKQKGNRFKPT